MKAIVKCFLYEYFYFIVILLSFYENRFGTFPIYYSVLSHGLLNRRCPWLSASFGALTYFLNPAGFKYQGRESLGWTGCATNLHNFQLWQFLGLSYHWKSWIYDNQNSPSEWTWTHSASENPFFSLFFQVVLVEKFIANLPTLSNWGEQVGGRASLNLPQKMMPLNAKVFIFFKMSYK